MVPTLEFPPVTESTDHVTAVLLVPCTVALNCVVAFTSTLTEDSLRETDTGAAGDLEIPWQPEKAKAIATPRQQP